MTEAKEKIQISKNHIPWAVSVGAIGFALLNSGMFVTPESVKADIAVLESRIISENANLRGEIQEIRTSAATSYATKTEIKESLDEIKSITKILLRHEEEIKNLEKQNEHR